MKTSTNKNQHTMRYLFNKNISTLFIFALLMFSINSNAQFKKVKGSGKIITETRTVAEFNKIIVSGAFHVQLIEGKEGTITVEASDNLMNVIETEVKNGVLKIKTKKLTNITNYKTINITVAVEAIEAITLSGSGSVITTKTLKSAGLTLIVSGSGNMNLNVTTTNLITNVSGSGNVKLAGESDVFSCAVSGSGNINGLALHANITNAKISGSGNVKIHAINQIHAKTSGSGNVIYTGDPTIVKLQSSGSGSIHKKN
jgi:hypothetical protein